MILDWLNSLSPAAGRRVALLYFPSLCWGLAALIVHTFW